MSGFTPQESQIMDLWDQGYSARQIAAALELDGPRVLRIVQLNYEGTELKRHTLAMERGSKALALAIIAARQTKFATGQSCREARKTGGAGHGAPAQRRPFIKASE